jgi:hypothetical protein
MPELAQKEFAERHAEVMNSPVFQQCIDFRGAYALPDIDVNDRIEQCAAASERRQSAKVPSGTRPLRATSRLPKSPSRATFAIA